MINNVIAGGQVFLHKVRMFSQVFLQMLYISLFLGLLAGIWINYTQISKVDWWGFLSYRKAVIAMSFDRSVGSFGMLDKVTLIDAKFKNRTWTNIDPYKVIRMNVFQNADRQGISFLKNVFWYVAIGTLSVFALIFVFWAKFGSNIKSEKKKDGSGELLNAKQVRRRLYRMRKASDFKIGILPLVKDMETQHILVTGATGSGKTNLIHNLLPQIEAKRHPVIVMDQTGEMISKYYDPKRGDIIFNPFDSRSKSWDFWADCGQAEEQKKFAKILMSFNRKQSGGGADKFWELAGTDVLTSILEYANINNLAIEDVAFMACYAGVSDLKNKLKMSKAAPHLSEDSKQTAASVVSVMATGAEPLTYLRRSSPNGSFSLKEHFANIDKGSDAWLFLATKPSSRELTLPLLSCITELALSRLVDSGINRNRRVWTVLDELPALGRLPALSFLMSEGRKYGASVIAGMQSINQLFENYGERAGSTIFGQFATCFFFKVTEPAISKMITSRCGTETLVRNQKNTSFGANSLRDGVSYSEHLQRKNLVEANDIAQLSVGECFVLLPEPEVAVSKIKAPEAKIENKNQGFAESTLDDCFRKMLDARPVKCRGRKEDQGDVGTREGGCKEAFSKGEKKLIKTENIKGLTQQKIVQSPKGVKNLQYKDSDKGEASKECEEAEYINV
ncbi:MAG: type IV secretion system DNA-binding domain-containing protein [Rickettsiaceae bacterium]|nr:type IV secretion system DNA-binding domain-containing protein [Rickettsiaceae bacterium]